MRKLEFKVSGEYSGKRVEDVLRAYFHISGSLIKDLKKYPEGLLLNGCHVRTVDCVNENDIVTINIRDCISENIQPVDMELDIVYEDEDILIVNKPPGMPTHPSHDHQLDTLANGVMAHYSKQNEIHTFRAVNRLDKDTSGIMCIAKNAYAHARLAEQLNDNHTLRRKYLAIVTGVTDDSGTINAPIARLDTSAIERCVHESGQRAVTHYRAVEKHKGYTLIELELETGRTHQIRVHMAYTGHPLLGDWLYGEENPALFSRQALHSSFLSLIHPVTGRKMEFFCKISPDMATFLEKC